MGAAAPPGDGAEALDEACVRLGAALLHQLKADAIAAQAAAYAEGGELSPRVPGLNAGKHAADDRLPPLQRGVSPTFMAGLEVFLAECGVAGETTLAELRRGGGPPPKVVEDGLPDWARGSGATAARVPGVGEADLPDVQQPLSLASLTHHTGLSLVESVLMVAKRERQDASALFRPVRSLFLCAEDMVCTSDLIDAVRIGAQRASAAEAMAVPGPGAESKDRGVWIDAFCLSPAEGREEAGDAHGTLHVRDSIVTTHCTDVIFYASPLMGEWQRPADPFLHPRDDTEEGATHRAAPVGVGPAALTRADALLAAGRVLADGRRMFVELSGYDREDLPAWLENQVLSLDDAMQHGVSAEGVQLESSGERSAYLERFGNFEGGVGGTLGVVKAALRGWLASEAMGVLRYLEELRGTSLPLPMREDLAKLYVLDGKAAEAEALLVLEATLREQALGNGHVETLAAVTSLAKLLLNQSKLGEATALYRHALKEYTATLGAESPLTLRTMVHLAELLADQLDTDEAASLYRAALRGFEATMGPLHPQTLQTTDHLGMVLAEQGKRALAGSVFKKALDGYMKAYGPKHPETLGTMSNLANALRLQGKLDTALSYYQTAVKGLEAALGASDRETLRATHGLAATLSAQRKHTEALPHYTRAHEGRCEALGPAHPSTLHSLSELAQAMLAVGRIVEAVKLHEDCVVGHLNCHGPDAEATLGAQERLGVALGKQGRLEEAEHTYRQLIDAYSSAMGDRAERTRQVAQRLVDNLIAQAKLLDAQDVAKRHRLEWSLRKPAKPRRDTIAGGAVPVTAPGSVALSEKSGINGISAPVGGAAGAASGKKGKLGGAKAGRTLDDMIREHNIPTDRW